MENQARQSSSSIMFSKYQLKKQLGEGWTSKVYLANDVEANVDVALKVFNSSAFFDNESSIMTSIEHDNIIKAYDKIDGGKKVLVMEAANKGELFNYIRKPGGLPKKIAQFIFKKLVSAVEYLHSNNIVHLDLKPDNVLLSDTFEPKLGDFGFAQRVGESQGICRTDKGTQGYKPPEVFLRRPYDGRMADIYSLGVTLFAIATGCPAVMIDALPTDRLYSFIVQKDMDSYFNIYSKKCTIDEDFKTLIFGMLAASPKERMTLEEIKRHPYYTEASITSEEYQSYMATVAME